MCYKLGRIKLKSAFEYEQNMQIMIILHMHKVSFRHLLAIHTFCSKIVLWDSEGPDQTLQMHRLIWAFFVHICPKTF